MKTPAGFPSFSANFLFSVVWWTEEGFCYTSEANHNHTQREHLHFVTHMCVAALCSLTGSSLGWKPPKRFLNIAGGPCQNEEQGVNLL